MNLSRFEFGTVHSKFKGFGCIYKKKMIKTTTKITSQQYKGLGRLHRIAGWPGSTGGKVLSLLFDAG
jgi:hypothetical protein